MRQRKGIDRLDGLRKPILEFLTTVTRASIPLISALTAVCFNGQSARGRLQAGPDAQRPFCVLRTECTGRHEEQTSTE